ncbi:MAG: hypothetical protein WCI20_06845 [bacterium]
MGRTMAFLVAGLICATWVQGASERVRFVPAAVTNEHQRTGAVTNWSQLGPLDEAAWNNGKIPVSTHADWTQLRQGPGKEPGRLFLMAHAGLDDAFPVQDSTGRTHFVVLLVEGDDNHLLLVVQSREGSQPFNVLRDKPVPVVVAGGKYDLCFPTVDAAAQADSKPTTERAMIIVHHFSEPKDGGRPNETSHGTALPRRR